MKGIFEPLRQPRVFYLPPGANFAGCLADGLLARLNGFPAETIARTTIITNTRRSARAIEAAFKSGKATLLPRIRVIADYAEENGETDQPIPSSAKQTLRSKLELAQFVRALLESRPGLAPLSAVYDLADSLAALLEEVQGEGVDLNELTGIENAAFAEHWETSKKFLTLLARHAISTTTPSKEARLRRNIGLLIESWNHHVPNDPVIVAGSTGSRGTTAMLMKAVASLPQGAIVLPGFDTNLPADVWKCLRDDHPQYRFAVLADYLKIEASPEFLRPWTLTEPPSRARNRLLSLALRPAPVTHQWMAECDVLRPGLATAVLGVSLIEAASQREESAAISVCLRQSLSEGKSAALITPDRGLARRVAAHLARWSIKPDDSAGTPLSLTAPGIFLRLTADLLVRRPTASQLLAILKHPLCGGSAAARTMHLEHTRNLERYFLRGGPPEITSDLLRSWTEKSESQNENQRHWVAWLAGAVAIPTRRELTLKALSETHFELVEHLSGGDHGQASTVWEKRSGAAARSIIGNLLSELEFAGAASPGDYSALLLSELSAIDVRDEAFIPNAQIAIWGTLEARIQCADVVILGGLNEGIWPSAPGADPWLNRAMRAKIGLPSPDRKTGLSAHDFQQASAFGQVVFSRSKYSDGAPTLPSRWLLRLTNMLGGMAGEGKLALMEMRGRGATFLEIAATFEDPGPEFATARAKRPAPCPPVIARPVALSVTQIETLIKDPYAIYARHILKLKKIDPLGAEPTALERGSALHAVMDAFLTETPLGDVEDLIRTASRVLNQTVPWPEVRRLWLAQITRSAERIVADVAERRVFGIPKLTEVRGHVTIAIDGGDFKLSAKADRIDVAPDGSAIIYDYKAGSVPAKKDIRIFAKQLLLEAAIAAGGGFADLGPTEVSRLEYLTLSQSEDNREVDVKDIPATWAEFLKLLRTYQDFATPFAARLRSQDIRYEQDFDHLSRKGEWEDGDDYSPEVVG